MDEYGNQEHDVPEQPTQVNQAQQAAREAARQAREAGTPVPPTQSYQVSDAQQEAYRQAAGQRTYTRPQDEPGYPGYQQQSYRQPGYQQQSYQQDYQQQSYRPPTQAQPAPGYDPNPKPPAHGEQKPKKDRGGLVVGLIGGVVGAVVMALIVLATGAFGLAGGSGSGSGTSGGSSSGTSGTITINSSDVDASTAEAVAAKAMDSVVSVYCTYSNGSGMGSGVIYDGDGDIITNYHVIDGATAISVTIDGKSYDATVVGSDSSSDIAVIKAELNGDSVTPIEVGDSDALAVGSWVMTIGSPFGLEQSASAGIVSALYRNELMEGTDGNTIYANLIQVDASINPGNSGGALVNDEGQLVGICTLYSSDTESFAGIGFAIPGNYAVQIADTIISGETVTHAYIGLSMQTVNSQNAQANNLSVDQGAYVVEVFDDSPAAEAGIEAGDIVIAMDGEEITSADGMILAVRGHDIGETVDVTVMRGDEEMTFSVTLGSDETLQEMQSQDTGDNGNDNGYNDQDMEDYLEELYEEWLEEQQNGQGGPNGNGGPQG